MTIKTTVPCAIAVAAAVACGGSSKSNCLTIAVSGQRLCGEAAKAYCREIVPDYNAAKRRGGEELATAEKAKKKCAELGVEL